MTRLPLTLVALALLAAGFYVLRYSLGCMAGILAEECHVFFGITVNGGCMVALGVWLLWKEFVRPRQGGG